MTGCVMQPTTYSSNQTLPPAFYHLPIRMPYYEYSIGLMHLLDPLIQFSEDHQLATKFLPTETFRRYFISKQ